MGTSETPKPLCTIFFFMKPADAVVADATAIAYPSLTFDLHHEVELVVAIGKGGVDIDPVDALDHVCGYAVGLDLTRRDLQATAKKFGRPWDWAKGFDQSAPCTALLRKETGKSFSLYLTEQRLQLARTLLLGSTQPVGQVAAVCGFSDESYFARCFRKHEGMAPSHFRRHQGHRSLPPGDQKP
ncbi:helix-turn-helix domain-containing protein [Pantoea sp. Ap-967]|uniref:fumarylacetoacetate hydrolase family protein n=1 Tax=Pantoea sp. Ap-967 TaxID=2608362 RepID=UPI00141E1D32|nr:fumarylacetoacetate hydrolase family protein [Pantoea sp. Ap-967]NIE73589.1 helix-turn-helix domain-containing protein [Pantoea sp. Ap-967]